MARATAERGYALALEAGEWVPDGMFITASAPSHSVRGATLAGKDVLIVSGEGHPVGEPEDGGGTEPWSRLAIWARDELGAGDVLYRWSTQDYYSHDRVPFIGALDARHRIYGATAFGGWGMTTGTVAGLLLRDLVCEVESPWTELYDPGRLKLAELPGLLKKGVHDAKRLVGDRVLGGESADAVSALVRGEGGVFSVDGERLAVHRETDGSLRAVSAVCTHLGCIVGWNGAEESWDCPCHGSRFSAAGEVLQGPATDPLADRTGLLVEHTTLGA
jgi:Rieske Fe-S protein